MPQKNLVLFINRKFENIQLTMYRNRFIIAIICALILFLGGCKKAIENISTNTLQTYFEDNILNKTFIVELAKDGTTDNTSLYTGYDFVLTKTTSYYDGPMTATKSGVTYTGTWISNDDYSKLVININSPTPPVEFVFLNRAWRFTKKNLPTMELAPWGNLDPKVLHMKRL